MQAVVIMSLVFVVSLLGAVAVRRIYLSRNLLDVPNARSSHAAPTPHGGGIAISVATCLGVLCLYLLGFVNGVAALLMVVGGGSVALVGALDDARPVAARWRLLVHVLAALWVVYWLTPMPPLAVPWGGLALGGMEPVLMLLFMVWLINLYNFMDGIDALAGLQAITVTGPAALLVWLAGEPGLALMLAVLAVAVAGFMPLNLPPARLFMGDAGSGFLGFALAACALMTHASQSLSLWSWLILLGVFIVDATFTLLRRLLRGDRWYQAHRSHAYQNAARMHASHGLVALAVVGINAFWLLPLAVLAAVNPAMGGALLVVAWGPLALLAWMYRAGAPETVRR